jgi:hypothetical protein
MSNYLNVKDVHKQKYSKKQGLGFSDGNNFSKNNKHGLKKLTK